MVSVETASGKKKGGEVTFETGVEGVVARVREGCLTVAVWEEVPEEVWGGRVRVLLRGGEVTYRRMLDALTDLERRYATTTPPSHVTALLGMSDPGFETIVRGCEGEEGVMILDGSLNVSQVRAVEFAVGAREVAVIHDTLVERLSKHRLNLARLGHPARVKREVIDHALEVRVRSSDEGKLVADVRTDLDRALAAVQKAKGRDKRREAYAEVKALRGELRTRERTVVQTIVRNTQVVLCTLSGAASTKLRNEVFDTVVIDEASQAIEAECWIALVKARKVILAGDHRQLPPTVKSGNSDTTKTGKKKKNPPADHPLTLELTLFDRLLAMYGDSIKRLLNVQYRMHEMIMRYPSTAMYQGSLIAFESVKGHLLQDLPGVKSTDETSTPILLINTSDSGMSEAPEADDEDSKRDFGAESLLNRGEADLAARHVKRLIEAGVTPSSIAIISPYSAQVRLLRSLLREEFPELEIGTVDSFQGAEREAIVLSLVRSNDKNEIGFLQDSRRLNVAVTRARRHLAVVADVNCMTRNPFLKGLFTFMEEHGDVQFTD
ncbi:hypothetical protein HDU67_007975 [Dinochytrium kinnereticum]|nr:hypothetical protein HDU67_007975 [Dinochytrium kinnereticum]